MYSWYFVIYFFLITFFNFFFESVKLSSTWKVQGEEKLTGWCLCFVSPFLNGNIFIHTFSSFFLHKLLLYYFIPEEKKRKLKFWVIFTNVCFFFQFSHYFSSSILYHQGNKWKISSNFLFCPSISHTFFYFVSWKLQMNTLISVLKWQRTESVCEMPDIWPVTHLELAQFNS